MRRKKINFDDDDGLQTEKFIYLRQVEKLTEKLKPFLYYLCAYIFLFLGISVNIYQQVIYFSEGSSIWVKGAANMSDVSDLMPFYTGWGNIVSISVDWLYQRIYFVMNEKVML